MTRKDLSVLALRLFAAYWGLRTLVGIPSALALSMRANQFSGGSTSLLLACLVIAISLGLAYTLWKSAPKLADFLFRDLELSREVEVLQVAEPEEISEQVDANPNVTNDSNWVWGMPLDWRDVLRVGLSFIGALVIGESLESLPMVFRELQLMVFGGLGGALGGGTGYEGLLAFALRAYVGYYMLVNSGKIVNFIERKRLHAAPSVEAAPIE